MIQSHLLILYLYSNSDVEQVSAVPEPAYELMDKSGDVKLEDNPAYSVTASQDSPKDHQYDVIPGGHHANAKH